MGKLNQVIAVVAGKKARAAQVITEAYHKLQKQGLFDGITRTYRPKDEDGEKFPNETKHAQVKLNDVLREVSEALVEQYDTVATQDAANCKAVADVKVNGTVILPAVPVTHLLFLEKQVNDLATFVSKLPTLDPADEWAFDSNADAYATEPSETVKTKKIPRNHVLAEATKEHPAQVQVYNEDVVVGYWKTIKFSGALPAKDKNAMADRVRLLHQAIVTAREEANSIEVAQVREGQAVLDFVFQGK